MDNQTTSKNGRAADAMRRGITGEAGYGSPVDDDALKSAGKPFDQSGDNTLNLVDDDEKAGSRGDVATE